MKNSITAPQKANVMTFENESTGSMFSFKWSKHRSPIVEEVGHIDSKDAHLQEFSDALKQSDHIRYIRKCGVLHCWAQCTKAEKTN